MTEHYFSGDPTVAYAPRTVRLVVDGRAVSLQSSSGVFSAQHLDAGTRILLDAVPSLPADATVLDLGCGYGPIACAAALRAPAATVWAVDVNSRARELTATNAEAHGLSTVRVGAPDDVPGDVLFDVIWSNPPIRVGKAALHTILLQWLARLAGGGVAYLVVARNLGADSLAVWLVEHGWACARLTSRQGYRVLAVQRP